MSDFYFIPLPAKFPLSRQVHNRFGVVASFTGTYRADEWTMKLSSKGTHSLVINCDKHDKKQLFTKFAKILSRGFRATLNYRKFYS